MTAVWRSTGPAIDVANRHTVDVQALLEEYTATGDLSGPMRIVSDRDIPFGASDSAVVRAIQARLAGRLHEAVTLAAQAVTQLATTDTTSSMLARGELAQAAALTGQVDLARRAIGDLESPGQAVSAGPWIDLARPWVVWAAGARSESTDIAAANAHRLRHWPDRGLELIALHDLVRLGQPASAVDRLSTLAGEGVGPLAAVCWRHAIAAAARDVGQLMQVADEFAALGHHLYAAGSAAAAESMARRVRGPGLAAVIGRARAFALPGLRLSAIPALSTRERHIAQLALTGLSSRRIGERLSLSARTLDSHLPSVYRKLVVSGRVEVHTALDA